MQLGSIQVLRAFAVTLIVYASSIALTQRFAKPGQGSFYYLNKFGFIGIDFFFIISGFIITYTAGQYTGFNKGLAFLQKRFFRVNPIYYAASLLFLGTSFLEMWVTGKNANLSGNHYISASVDTLFIVPVANSPFLYGPIMSVGWTLAFAWLFYGLFFFGIITKVKRKIIVLTGFILVLVFLKYLLPYSGLRQAFLTNPILLEFLLGVLICQVYSQVKKIPHHIPITLLFLGIAWYVVLVFYNNPAIAAMPPIFTGGLSMERFMYWGIPSSFMVAGCIFLEKNGQLNKLWNNRILRLLGNASYSIFLVQASVFVLVGIAYNKLQVMLVPDLSIFIQVAIAIVAGIGFYWWVEKPLLRWFQETESRPISTSPVTEASVATTS